jgi:SiaC family regulatory phosphoprotein
MEDLFIQGTDSLPNISFRCNGELKITGRALPEDANSFFRPILDWLREFSADEVNIEFNLDYFNTSVSKQILDMFKIIEGNPANKAIKIKWMYEDGDEEMLESGEIYSEMLKRFQFTFHKYAEIID